MTKRAIIFLVALLFFISCSKNDSNVKLVNESSVENGISTQSQTQAKKDISEVEDFFKFQNKILNKYKEFKLTGFEVSKYAKGIELLFITSDMNFSKEKFIEISKYSLDELKNTYEIDKTLKIHSSISYQKDSKSNAVFLYNYK